jgi:hypothetical protein
MKYGSLNPGVIIYKYLTFLHLLNGRMKKSVKDKQLFVIFSVVNIVW